jgi:hypothetical protein
MEAELLIVMAGGTYSYHWALKGQYISYISFIFRTTPKQQDGCKMGGKCSKHEGTRNAYIS